MNVIEAVLKRQSIRAFKPDPVPPELLNKIMETALRVPSSGNSQPCEYAVVSGARLESIKSGILASLAQMPNPDIPAPMEYPEPWRSRYGALMRGVQQLLGITREEKQKRADWNLWGMKMWGAPACIFIYIDRDFFKAAEVPNFLNIFDCGMAAQTIMLLATGEGLGTIPAIMPVLYPDVLRRELSLPANKLFVLGIPVGYIDHDHPANQFRSAREPLEKMVRFY